MEKDVHMLIRKTAFLRKIVPVTNVAGFSAPLVKPRNARKIGNFLNVNISRKIQLIFKEESVTAGLRESVQVKSSMK